MQSDTIAAIATPPGVGGVGIVRVSGEAAFSIVLPLFRRPGGEQTPPPSHQLTYGRIVDPRSGEVLDEVLVAFMCRPHTYTREDVVEIQGHGGPLVLQRILRLVLEQGARLAQPGEFTLRAFLNGRLDLAQAEAVMDVISARTEAGLRLAMQQLQGRVSARLHEARQTVLGVLARIEASIDFPEDDIPTPRADELRSPLLAALSLIDELLAGAEQGRLYRYGLRTVIIGRPNVGKSSLLNALLRSERAIVTPIAGTTRDTVEEVANLRGIPLHLIDTAGITPTDDPVEQIGIQRSRAAAESADLALLVFDGAEDFTAQDRQVCEELQRLGFGQEDSETANGRTGRPLILVLNKIDRPRSLPLEQVRRFWPQAPLVMTSTLTGEGLSQLEETIANLVLAGRALQSDSVLVTNLRHQEALRLASQHLQAALATLAQDLPLDFVSIDLQAACHALGEITGETASADLLERIFSEFCIGK
ncbi:tRNA uridine-5-carboxymethylaminomethyl(34) synthesis GTPase MnmE [Thermogemmatispora carboxidivorans]|uniref:tRNA uridine-5-carboxymethylaminomethyl(34) synthesis GTPase MnmE n=1 Tax=Thermogemmatispora carboxidivorans TaxID=1382306 RepID=UPI00069AC26C|nr:tRNA uridine-5-carboxymethylaminomethyl(34) synthesis GTPase MnmE [Thermogemmatispora carboxidivorans]